MVQQHPSESIVIRTTKAAEIDALAITMERSRNDIVNQAIEQYLTTNTWQIKRIREGVTAVRDGRTVHADDTFTGIATKHGWSR